jgi:hypothetical protein
MQDSTDEQKQLTDTAMLNFALNLEYHPRRRPRRGIRRLLIFARQRRREAIGWI